MSKLKAIIMNPVLLGVEGFVIGAALLWSTAAMPEGVQTPSPAAGPSLIAPTQSVRS